MKDRAYVSEFTRFMDNYLVQHPEVVRDQKLGWRIWWERPTNLRELDYCWHEEIAGELPYYSYLYE